MTRPSRFALAWCAFAAACSSPPASGPDWDPEADAIRCASTLDAPLLDVALADAEMTRDQVGFDEETWQGASYRSVLDDRFRLPWFRETHWDAIDGSPCFAAQLSFDLDHAMRTAHPVATALGEAIDRLGRSPGGKPLNPATARQDLVDLSALPGELRSALVPILAALERVAASRETLAGGAPASANQMVQYGHGGILVDYRAQPDLTDAEEQAWVLNRKGPAVLYDPARELAFAVEHADLERFAGLSVTFDAESPVGRVVIAGPGPDAPGDIGNVALYLDLGGDDVYVHPAGASGADVPGAVHVDLGGNDLYTYETTDETSGPLLPADAGGRYDGDGYYGRFSLSRVGRQGSGRFGVGMLFDLGAGDDRYESLRASQGWGALGVGVLYDDGGNDAYLGEAGVQGAASMGIGLLIDAGAGNDVHRTFANSQGFGYLRAVGAAWDGGGADVWFADPGDPDLGGTPLYYSPQLPEDGNSSFSQGAGLGMRNDAAETFLSGGLGVLRDVGGDDAYTASVFGQGTGYWQGTGLLLDGEGADTYEALWYVQGGAAHYAIGALLDGGSGNDRFNPTFMPRGVHMGSGHDFSVGLLINDAGDDTYRFSVLAAGASNCQGIGLFVDNDGADAYLAESDYGVGLGNHSAECDSSARTVGRSVGLFLDSGGDADAWTWPATDRVPGDDRTFGRSWSGTGDEHGGAVDGAGETAFRAAPIR